MKLTGTTVVIVTLFLMAFSISGGLFAQSSYEEDARESMRRMLSVQPLIDVVRWRAGLRPVIEEEPGETRCGVVFVQWDDVPRAEGYELYRNGLLAYRGEESSFTDRGRVLGRDYRYTVRAMNAGGASELSEIGILRALTPCPPQSAPEEVQVSPGRCGGAVRLSWSEVEDATTYQLSRGDDRGGRVSMIPHLTGRSRTGGGADVIFEGAGTEYIDTEVEPDTEVTYSIRSVNRSGMSEESTRVSARSSSECSPEAPRAPRQ